MTHEIDSSKGERIHTDSTAFAEARKLDKVHTHVTRYGLPAVALGTFLCFLPSLVYVLALILEI